MAQCQNEQVVEYIIGCIEEAGYCAKEQLTAYVMSSDMSYITRHGNARDLIGTLDIKWIKKYLHSYNKRMAGKEK